MEVLFQPVPPDIKHFSSLFFWGSIVYLYGIILGKYEHVEPGLGATESYPAFFIGLYMACVSHLVIAVEILINLVCRSTVELTGRELAQRTRAADARGIS